MGMVWGRVLVLQAGLGGNNIFNVSDYSFAWGELSRRHNYDAYFASAPRRM